MMGSAVDGGNKFADEIAKLDLEAQKITTPCADGDLVFRHWPATKPTDRKPLLLVHGGSGSWTHWYLNIPILRQHYDLYALDLPGLGDSASLPEGYAAADVVEVVECGIRAVFSDKSIHVSAFSWGCAVMSQVSGQFPDQFLSLTLVGPASLGDVPRLGAMQPLIKKTPEMSAAERFEANRKNLGRLMIFDQSRIDDLAVYLQTENTRRARFNSPQFGNTRLTLDGVAANCIPLQVIYGSEDIPAKPDVVGKEKIFRDVRPDLTFHLVGGCGHWLQYENPEEFHRLILSWTNQNESQPTTNICNR